MIVNSNERIPIKMWLNEIDENALAQARNLANLPFAFKHIAIMKLKMRYNKTREYRHGNKKY